MIQIEFAGTGRSHSMKFLLTTKTTHSPGSEWAPNQQTNNWTTSWQKYDHSHEVGAARSATEFALRYQALTIHTVCGTACCSSGNLPNIALVKCYFWFAVASRAVLRFTADVFFFPPDF